MAASKLFNAICFFPSEENKSPLKYRKIINEKRFNDFIKSKGCKYYNKYENKTKTFIERIYL